MEYNSPTTPEQREYVNTVNRVTIPITLTLVAGISLKRSHLRLIETSQTVRSGDGTPIGELRASTDGTWQIKDNVRQETWDIDMRQVWSAFQASVSELPSWLSEGGIVDAPASEKIPHGGTQPAPEPGS